jgi:hypothetical protein
MFIQCSILIFLFHFSSCNQDTVTCGSTFKLLNQQSGDRLHSHDVKYGSGSGQQVKSLFIPRFLFLFQSFSLSLVHPMRMMLIVIGKFVVI